MNQKFGFSKENAVRQKKYEQLFLQKVKPWTLGHFSREISRRPGVVGTEGSLAGVKKSVEMLRQYGLNPEVKNYDVYMSYPKHVAVTKTKPQYHDLEMVEEVPPGTPYADDIIPGYNAFSPSGDVEAELVYANYGRPEDFDELERRGVSVQGKMVITRYGENFRAVKSRMAEERGAAGVLIYSDPIDDGYTKGAVYPDGPWRPADAIQRGTILYNMAYYPGDPLTPGKPSKPGVDRIEPDEATSLPKIPTTSLAYGQAKYLLETMKGDRAPESWQGSLPFSYRLGPGSTKVRLSLDIDYRQRSVHDILVKIPGAKHPEQTILIGAHHDAWVYGANDNRAGWSTAMEVARVLGEMYQKGWQPERSIVIAGWDGEEYGLLGSTEWVEDYRDSLVQNAILYLNMDAIAGEFFTASAVPSLNKLIYDVTREVIEPRSGASIYDDWVTRSDGNQPDVGYLGGGSDYTGFLQHLGIASAAIGFNSQDGLYHSAYDNTDSIERFLDPGYKHQAAAAQITGCVALRMANAGVLPFRYSDYADELVQLLEKMAQKYTMGVDLSPLVEQAKYWHVAAAIFEQEVEKTLESGDDSSGQNQLSHMNDALMKQERHLAQPEGLPGRPWYKHQIWAPSLITGYQAQPLPALAQTLREKDRDGFQHAADVLQHALEQATETIQSPLSKFVPSVE